jgi:hypothetical protein
VGYVAWMEPREMNAKCWSINLKGRSHMREVSLDWSTSASEGPELESWRGY